MAKKRFSNISYRYILNLKLVQEWYIRNLNNPYHLTAFIVVDDANSMKVKRKKKKKRKEKEPYKLADAISCFLFDDSFQCFIFYAGSLENISLIVNN